MRSLELAITIAAAGFALACLVLASSAPHLVPVESPAARMKMVEAH